jgi:hypothetical protein
MCNTSIWWNLVGNYVSDSQTVFYGSISPIEDTVIYPDFILKKCFNGLFLINIVACMQRLYKTGIGLTTGFIGSHTVTHNYSVYTLTAPYRSLQHLPSSLVACLPISQDPFACNSATLL